MRENNSGIPEASGLGIHRVKAAGYTKPHMMCE